MINNEPRRAPQASSILRKSSAGYEFDENHDEWMLDGSIRISLSFLSELGVEKKTADGFRMSLSRYAQDLSSSHCRNIRERALNFFKVTEAKSFSIEALSSFRSNLDDEHMWYLGVLRGFLDSWNEWRFPGIAQTTIDYLDGLTVQGNTKGFAVLTNCPYSGPYSLLEHQSLLFGLAIAYEAKSLLQQNYSFLLAVSMTGQRPVQIRHLKFCDLGFDDIDGARYYYLDIPKASDLFGGHLIDAQ